MAANSFSIKLDEYEINGKRKTEQKIIVMKENHNILNFDDLNRTFSTITRFVSVNEIEL